jgi:drug/metabolite transporter (DMT)-like permease
VALVAALVTVALWASAFVGIRAAGEDLSPGALSLGRLAVGSALLGIFVLLQRGRLPGRRDWPGIVVCGVLWFGLYNLALNAAEQRGAVVIGLATSERGVGAGWGAVLCVAAAAFYAGGVVAQKPLLSRASALHVTWLAATVGLVVCLPFATTLADEVGDADASSIAWMVYLGVFPTAIGFLTWAYALSRTTAGRMGATTYLVPPIAILIGWALLAESPETLAFLGGALCLGGVVITRR